jgi:hypothetical protein
VASEPSGNRPWPSWETLEARNLYFWATRLTAISLGYEVFRGVVAESGGHHRPGEVRPEEYLVMYQYDLSGLSSNSSLRAYRSSEP